MPKLLVLLGGVLGVVAFFVSLATVTHGSVSREVVGYEVVVMATAWHEEIDKLPAAPGHEAEVAEGKAKLKEELSAIRSVAIACFVPAAILALLGLVGVIRRAFGRFAGIAALLFGAFGLLIWALLNAATDAPGTERGIGLYLLAGSGFLGALGGAMAIAQPERRPGTT